MRQARQEPRPTVARPTVARPTIPFFDIASRLVRGRIRPGRMRLAVCRTLIALALLAWAGCSPKADRKHVVLYTSQDQFYAEAILQEFTAATGIEVRPVFDTESAKTAGLAHRLRAERQHPQCDLFWSNEEMHTRLLVRDGVIASGDWRQAGVRTRRVVINTNLVSPASIPASLLQLTNAEWRGRVALAYPLFGTTQSHFLALRQLWGEEVWQRWCEGLVRNGARVVDGNALVVRLVGAGESAIGLTDSDDIAAGLRLKLPIAALETNGESIAIFTTIGLIRGAPRTGPVQTLMDYLARPETIQRLVALGALESAGPPAGPLCNPDWDAALKDAEAASAFLRLVFLRK